MEPNRRTRYIAERATRCEFTEEDLLYPKVDDVIEEFTRDRKDSDEKKDKDKKDKDKRDKETQKNILPQKMIAHGNRKWKDDFLQKEIILAKRILTRVYMAFEIIKHDQGFKKRSVSIDCRLFFDID